MGHQEARTGNQVSMGDLGEYAGKVLGRVSCSWRGKAQEGDQFRVFCCRE